MKKCSIKTAIVIACAMLIAVGVIGGQLPAFAQDGFPAMPKIAPKGFIPGNPLPSPPAPKGLYPGKWKLEITEEIEKPKEPQIKKENPLPAILERLQAPGPAIKIDIKKPEVDKKGKKGKNGNGKNGKGKKNGKDSNEKDDKDNGEDEEIAEPEEGWDVDRPWVTATQG
jgi:hypothetical protein